MSHEASAPDPNSAKKNFGRETAGRRRQRRRLLCDLGRSPALASAQTRPGPRNIRKPSKLACPRHDPFTPAFGATARNQSAALPMKSSGEATKLVQDRNHKWWAARFFSPRHTRNFPSNLAWQPAKTEGSKRAVSARRVHA